MRTLALSGPLTYGEMRESAWAKARAAGFDIGTTIKRKDQVGKVVDINPFCFDHDPMPIYVDLEAAGKKAARHRELVNLADLVIVTPEAA